MAGINDFLSFAIGGGANVLPQEDYAVLPAVATGFQAGIAESEQLNKVWRQATQMAYVMAQFIISQDADQDVLDNGNPNAILAQFIAAVSAASRFGNARLITSSATLNLELTDGVVGFNRTAAVAPQTVNLPNGMTNGQKVSLIDVVGNFNANPITVVPPAGDIAGLSQWVLNTDRGGGTFTYFGANKYGVQLG